jgi:phosphotriesterase-related protein
VTAVVRTVLGDIDPTELGVTDYHEHLFQSTPLLPGEDLDDEPASTAEAGHLRASGAAAMVEATPIGLGRRPAATARVSAATGLRVVHVTGAHRQAHYTAGDPLLDRSTEQLAALFTGELLDGMDGTPVRAGALKAGAGLWSLTGFERRALAAVGQVAGRTGAPVMVHLEHGSAAHEVLDLLLAEGCAESRVALAHIDRNPDPGLHLELAARGAYLGYDGAARHQRWPDSVLIDCLAAVVTGGGGERLLLGGDVARRSRYLAYGGMPGLGYLLTRFAPRVRQAIGEERLDAVLRLNPARWLSWEPPR